MMRLAHVATLSLLVATLAGCTNGSLGGDADPEHADPVLFALRVHEPPERFVDWNASVVASRPVLRPLADLLADAAGGKAQVTVTQEQSREIMDYLGARWREKYPGQTPSPPILRHENAYYSIALAV